MRGPTWTGAIRRAIVLAAAITAAGAASASAATVAFDPADPPTDLRIEAGPGETNAIRVSQGPALIYETGATRQVLLVDDVRAPLRSTDPRCRRTTGGYACLADAPDQYAIGFLALLGDGDDYYEAHERASVYTGIFDIGDLSVGARLGLPCGVCWTLSIVDGGPGDDLIDVTNLAYPDWVFCGDGIDVVRVDYQDGPRDFIGDDCEGRVYVHMPNYDDE